jgi:hypothetical protein
MRAQYWKGISKGCLLKNMVIGMKALKTKIVAY